MSGTGLDDLFCPDCGAPIAHCVGSVATMHRHDVYGARVEYTLETFLYCTHCPLATSVDTKTGRCVNIDYHIDELAFPLDVRRYQHEATS